MSDLYCPLTFNAVVSVGNRAKKESFECRKEKCAIWISEIAYVDAKGKVFWRSSCAIKLMGESLHRIAHEYERTK